MGASSRAASSSSSPIRSSKRATSTTTKSARIAATTAAMTALRSGLGELRWSGGVARSTMCTLPVVAAFKVSRSAILARRLSASAVSAGVVGAAGTRAVAASIARWMSACAVSRRIATISSANAFARAAAFAGESHCADTVTTSEAPCASTATASLSCWAVTGPGNRRLTFAATESREASARFVAAVRSGHVGGVGGAPGDDRVRGRRVAEQEIRTGVVPVRLGERPHERENRRRHHDPQDQPASTTHDREEPRKIHAEVARHPCRKHRCPARPRRSGRTGRIRETPCRRPRNACRPRSMRARGAAIGPADGRTPGCRGRSRGARPRRAAVDCAGPQRRPERIREGHSDACSRSVQRRAGSRISTRTPSASRREQSGCVAVCSPTPWPSASHRSQGRRR